MQPEIEAKFLDIAHDGFRQRLRAAGAVCVHPMRIMKRKNYDFSDGRLRREKNGWVRVRDEGGKVTMSYKQLNNRQLDGTQEVQLVIDSFDAAGAFLEALGLEAKNYQETKRESWTLDGCEIELDVWPWTKPYVEVEGPDEQTLRALARKLDLDWAVAYHGSVEIVYQAEYDITEDDFKDLTIITFDEPLPELFKERQRA